MRRMAIFVDGGYLDWILRDSGAPRIDYEKLAAWIARDHELLRTYYYHCLPYQSSPPSREEAARFGAKQRFFAALRRLDRFEVREGKLEYRGTDRGTGTPIFEQKRVDILLAVDLVLLATRHRIDTAAVISGDSDFLPAIAAAKNEGVMIHLCHGVGPTRPHRDLWDVADIRTTITPTLLDSILR